MKRFKKIYLEKIKNFDIKKIGKNILKSIKKYASTNILFLSYVIISLLIGFLLRLGTIGTPLYFKALLLYFFNANKKGHKSFLLLIFINANITTKWIINTSHTLTIIISTD